MLKFLDSFKTKKIAVLGDMRELGSSNESEHNNIYQQAVKIVDLLISVGPETKKYFGDKSVKFDYWWQAAEFLKQQLVDGETILVKGSQNTIFLEELVKSILKNPSDSSKLCRQSKWWLKTKNNFKNQSK
ncbi:UDP-N-acetylmuramoyl-tripeptide--D-alanyl-D-alanine ligase [bioreactor metagenome]|uniref:UDP-N-acetylmuramoyl-tripeptide--D-alanyl-D-alanine ligase n=1 Tax=bioreactor metagenome TaxID=1076179 RepID=A0A645FNW8_9ZZZZ